MNSMKQVEAELNRFLDSIKHCGSPSGLSRAVGRHVRELRLIIEGKVIIGKHGLPDFLRVQF